MSNAVTFYFNDIFPTYDEWKTFMTDSGVIDYSDALLTSFDEWAYNVIKRRFKWQNVRYAVPEQFQDAIANVYESRVMAFFKQKQMLESLYKLTDDDIVKVGESLINYANNPNTAPSDPLAPLPYVSNQNYSVQENNRYNAYLRAINNMPILNIDEFLRGGSNYDGAMSFENLFMNVQPNINFWYKGEN